MNFGLSVCLSVGKASTYVHVPSWPPLPPQPPSWLSLFLFNWLALPASSNIYIYIYFYYYHAKPKQQTSKSHWCTYLLFNSLQACMPARAMNSQGSHAAAIEDNQRSLKTIHPTSQRKQASSAIRSLPEVAQAAISAFPPMVRRPFSETWFWEGFFSSFSSFPLMISPELKAWKKEKGEMEEETNSKI